MQPAGTGATVDYRFRNGKSVAFEAHAIKVRELLDDVKNYLKSNPNQINWEQINISDTRLSAGDGRTSRNIWARKSPAGLSNSIPGRSTLMTA